MSFLLCLLLGNLYPSHIKVNVAAKPTFHFPKPKTHFVNLSLSKIFSIDVEFSGYISVGRPEVPAILTFLYNFFNFS
jgi:hypothetical protein